MRGPYKKKFTLEKRLWSRVRKGTVNECWPWSGALKDGYGIIGAPGGVPLLRCHRVAWELTNGPVPKGIDVLHTCDNPRCCNPAHLFHGTQLENMRDMSIKGRHVGYRKLTSQDVLWIRSKWRFRKFTCIMMARQLGVSKECVWEALRHKNWKHVK